MNVKYSEDTAKINANMIAREYDTQLQNVIRKRNNLERTERCLCFEKYTGVKILTNISHDYIHNLRFMILNRKRGISDIKNIIKNLTEILTEYKEMENSIKTFNERYKDIEKEQKQFMKKYKKYLNVI